MRKTCIILLNTHIHTYIQHRESLKAAIITSRGEFAARGGQLLPYADPDALMMGMGVVAMKDLDMHKGNATKGMSAKANERCGRFTKEEDAILMRAIENAIARCDFLCLCDFKMRFFCFGDGHAIARSDSCFVMSASVMSMSVRPKHVHVPTCMHACFTQARLR